MKHTTHTPNGTVSQSRNVKAVLLAFALLAVIFMIAAPAPAQDDFPWAKRVVISGPTSEELRSKNIFKMIDLPDCPQWAKDIFSQPNDVYDLEDDPINKTMTLLQFLHTYNRNPFFTPDGKWIIFDDFLFAAWMIPVEGGEPRLASDWYMSFIRDWNSPDKKIIGGSAGIWRTCGLTPDGKEVVGVRKLFVDEQQGDNSYTVTMPDGTTVQAGELLTRSTTLVSRNIDTGVERIISKDAIQGRWSHDGRWFVFVKRDPNMFITPKGWNLDVWEPIITGMYVRDMSNGNEWQIAQMATCPCFSPDDSMVICSMKDANGLWQIFSIPCEGGVPKQLTFYGPNNDGRNARVSDVSPDGQWILHTGDFTSGSETKTGLCVSNMVTGVSYPLFPDAQCVTTEGSWSPDGRKIVFSASYPGFEDGVRVGDRYAIYVMDFDPMTFRKPSAVAELVPAGFAVTGNYPNPFNPSTTISFSLSEMGSTTLTVYDVLGRKVRTLLDAQLQAGKHSVVWDGRDDGGNMVSSGVYIPQLVSGGNVAAGRMMLTK
ncbi:T9SS type A sorting domain-containing protein [bacterium]|nr:T9SS type A sorting domain-containing protein [bacterium]